MEVNAKVQSPAALLPGRKPCAHWIEVWVPFTVWGFGGQKNTCPCQDWKPGPSRPQLSHFTDCDNPVLAALLPERKPCTRWIEEVWVPFTVWHFAGQKNTFPCQDWQPGPSRPQLSHFTTATTRLRYMNTSKFDRPVLGYEFINALDKISDSSVRVHWYRKRHSVETTYGIVVYSSYHNCVFSMKIITEPKHVAAGKLLIKLCRDLLFIYFV
jgi:hypothetical protein